MNLFLAIAVLLFPMNHSVDEETCSLPPWPDEVKVVPVSTFADLQHLYQNEVPAVLNSKPVLEAAERAAKAYEHFDWKIQAAHVGEAAYSAQFKALRPSCGTGPDEQRLAAGFIENAYARVLAHTALRENPEEAARLLPVPFSKNLTPRVVVIGLSLGCSGQTPAVARLLARIPVPCGLAQTH